jgi:hypothetical protein
MRNGRTALLDDIVPTICTVDTDQNITHRDIMMTDDTGNIVVGNLGCWGIHVQCGRVPAFESRRCDYLSA